VVDISVILATARGDHPIIGLPDVHIFQPTFRSLERQSFRSFELIVVDALYPKRQQWIKEQNLSFPVKYLPPHPNHRFWLNRGLWCVSGMLNSALIHAEGELVVRIDDCSEFEEWYIQRFWEGYRRGYFPMAMHIRYHAGKPARVNAGYLNKGYEAKYAPMPSGDRATLLMRLYGENGIVRDTRWPTVEKAGRMVAPPEWGYGYTSYSLEALLRVNGFNELFDGVKGQEDQDIAIRMHLAGYRDTFLLDKDLWVIEHEHLPAEVNSPPPFKCNYGIIQHEQAEGLYRANEWRLSRGECERIRRNICPKCPNYTRCLGEELKGRFYVEGELFDVWVENQKTFNLRDEVEV